MDNPATIGINHDDEYDHLLKDYYSHSAEEVRVIFDLLDTDKNGLISMEDIEKASHPLCQYGSLEGLKEMIEETGSIHLKVLTNWITNCEEDLHTLYEFVADPESGRIDFQDVKKVFRILGISLERSEKIFLKDRVQSDGSLFMTFFEWRDLFLFRPNLKIRDVLKAWKLNEIFIEDLPADYCEQNPSLLWRHFLAGGLAGFMSRTCTAPLDRIKIMMTVIRDKFTGLRGCCKYIYAEGGIRAFWRGNFINITKKIPESALKFGIYDELKYILKRIQHTEKELGMNERFIAGALAGAISQSTVFPLDVLKTRYSVGTTNQYGAIALARKIYRKEGIRAFYRGFVPNIMGVIPYAGIERATYETIKRAYIKKYPMNSEPGPGVLLCCGITSTTCGQVVGYPFTNVCTRLQALKIPTADHQPSLLEAVRTVIKTEGLRGFYKGSLANFMKVAPSINISYLVYEQARYSLGIQKKHIL